MNATAPFQPAGYSIEEFAQLPNSKRMELIDGCVVDMTPTTPDHGFIEASLCGELREYVRQHSLGWVFAGEVGIVIRQSPARVRAAEGLFVSRKKHVTRPRSTPYFDFAPDLVLEVVSVQDKAGMIREKLADYFSIGIPEVWMVNPMNESVKIYRSLDSFVELGREDVLKGSGSLDGFSLPLAELFE